MTYLDAIKEIKKSKETRVFCSALERSVRIYKNDLIDLLNESKTSVEVYFWEDGTIAIERDEDYWS